jgi:hypothetical protein
LASAPESPRTSRTTWILFVGFFALFTVGLIGFMLLYLWPKGERLGELDLRAPAATLPLDLSAGDALHFRLDVTVATQGYPTSARPRRDAIYERLRASTLTISSTPAGGTALTTTCAAYDGKSMSSSGSSSEVSVGGVPITCTLEGLAPGRHVISAKVAWATNADVRASTLEVRRERTK